MPPQWTWQGKSKNIFTSFPKHKIKQLFWFPHFSSVYIRFFFYPLLKQIDGAPFSEQMVNRIPRSQI